MSKISEPYSFSYRRPFIFAATLHILILAFLIMELTFPSSNSGGAASGGSGVIHATAISQSVIDGYEKQVQQQQAQQQQAQQKKEKQQQQLEQLEQLKKAKQEQEAVQQKLQADKAIKEAQEAKANQEKALLLEAQKVVAKKVQEKQEAVKQKAALKEQMKKMMQQELKKEHDKAINKALKSDMQKELAQDQDELNANTKAKKTSSSHSSNNDAGQGSGSSSGSQNPGEIDKYKSLIIRAISQQWVVPDKLSQNISCILSVRVAPGGAVISVSIEKSSGSDVLDNSAMAAVHKASPLPVPASSALFDQFRELRLTVKPDGSMTD